jgi:hypothetical protein
MLQHMGNELRTVVHPQHLRRPVPQHERFVELAGQPLCGDRPLYDIQEGLPGVFVDHRRDLDRLTIDGRIELRVLSPQHFRGIGFDLRS